MKKTGTFKALSIAALVGGIAVFLLVIVTLIITLPQIALFIYNSGSHIANFDSGIANPNGIDLILALLLFMSMYTNTSLLTVLLYIYIIPCCVIALNSILIILSAIFSLKGLKTAKYLKAGFGLGVAGTVISLLVFIFLLFFEASFTTMLIFLLIVAFLITYLYCCRVQVKNSAAGQNAISE